MKYFLLPTHLLKFWYVESLSFFILTWKNLILYLEEDLGFGLMWKLLFVPLFHDSSLVGHILSFIFRLVRILLGLFAFALATIMMVALAILWFALPVAAIWGFSGILSLILLLTGMGLFLIRHLSHPHKTLWQVHQGDDFWAASLVAKEKLNFTKLLLHHEVINLLAYLEKSPDIFKTLNFSSINIEKVGEEAFNLAKRTSAKYIGVSHFFVAYLKIYPQIENHLAQFSLELADFAGTLFYQEKKKNSQRLVFFWDDDFNIRHLRGVNRGWLGAPTPTLDSVSQDLTREASKVGFEEFLGRTSLVRELVNVLSQDLRQNVVLVGSPGTGKTALIQYLAKQILAGDAPPSLATKRVVALDNTKLLSGMRTQGELADRVKNIFAEVSFVQNIILVVEEIHNLGIGEVATTMNLYSLMLPYMESSSFQFIATTEQENYSKILEKQAAFARLFTKIEIPPASLDETVEILEKAAISFERERKIRTSYLAIGKMAELGARLIKDRVLPDSALFIFREAQTQPRSGWITQQVVSQIVSERVSVPVVELGNVAKEKLLNLEEAIHQRLIDQEEAVRVVADSLRRSAIGLREETRPMGSFLFVGPTGVGKTEAAKTLAEVYFKNQGAFLRFDMSEYQSSDAVGRLIGSQDEGGQLTEAVREKPFALLLLDELEKADQKILTLFLQVLEDGRLTDGAGKTVDFTNTIIIATSNAASLTIAHGLEKGQSLEELKSQVSEELLQIFKPELINRFDDVVLFKPLSKDNLQKIVTLKLAGLQNQMRENGFLVEFDEGLVVELAKRGFDSVLGARPLRRLIQDTLEANLSHLILENKLVKGQLFKAGVELLG
ncbi:ATP-dependent Clp protease ATP-binding subunit [Candidatus Daviesbacteria bacterium]|nr:ATP-dependent Clp protease ATP-binding subunit [Candidatus Daviesbacteria bacterium]